MLRAWRLVDIKRITHSALALAALLVGIISSCSAPHGTAPALVKPSPSGLTMEQRYHMAEDHGSWYYSDAGVYRMSKLSGETSLLVDEGVEWDDQVWLMCLSDGWLYYAPSSDYGHYFKVCRVRPDGSAHEELLADDRFVEGTGYDIRDIRVSDGHVYIQASFLLYDYSIATNTVSLLDSDVLVFHVAGDSMYYIGKARKDFTIYVMDLKTGETGIVLGDGVSHPDSQVVRFFSNFAFVGDTMYYYMRFPEGSRGLYRHTGGGGEKIDDDNPICEYSLFEHGGFLYYVARDAHSSRLLRFDPWTSQVEEVVTCSHSYSRGGRIIDGGFYYIDAAGEYRQEVIP
jgi:hypothetical protein